MFWRFVAIIGAMAALLLLAGGAKASSGCARFSQHQFEVCTAYVFNDAGARRNYYKHGRDDRKASFFTRLRYRVTYDCDTPRGVTLADLAACRMHYRFHGDARQMLEGQNAGWPGGERRVDFPVVRITSVRASLRTNTATLRTVESWDVATGDGESDLFHEESQHHTVHMRRVRGIAAHIWVVTSIS